MRRAYLGVVLAVVLPAISVFAQGRGGGGQQVGGGGHAVGGGGGHGGFGGHVGFGHAGGGLHDGFDGHGRFHSGHGGFGRGGFHGGHGFYHGRGYYHGHGFGGVVILGGYGFPYCYPYSGYYGYPYYNDSPYYTAPDYDYGYYGTAPDVTYDEPINPPVTSSSQTSTYTAQDAQGYYAVGDQWGAGMKQYKLTVDQLVAYLKSYIVNATPAQQSAFRAGFIASAMPNAAATFDGAMQQTVPAPQS